MNNSHIATAVALRDLGCYSLGTIDERILLQKKVYLAQDLGLPLGYGYSWYIHGPYSTDLAAAAYQIIPEGLGAIKDKKFNPPYAEMIKRVNELENDISNKKIRIGVVQWFELLSSIAYWQKHGYITESQVVEKIKETKPQFSEEQIEAGYSTYYAFKVA